MKREGKRVLIITYYWPPSGGVAVQRWLKFVKYLRSYGWEPVVYTPDNPEMFFEDSALSADIPEGLEVIRKPIWEPYNIYRTLTRQKGERLAPGFASAKRKNGSLERFMVWLRGNLLIPDPRVFWVGPSVRYLQRYLKRNPVRVIVTTGPPHSLHLIGRRLKKRTGIPWLADFRDPWTNIDFYRELRLGPVADALHHRLERKVVANADVTVVVSEQMNLEFSRLNAKRVEVITNGFDESDFPPVVSKPNERFVLVHAGTVTRTRNPRMLWKVLGEICQENPQFDQSLSIELAGRVDREVIDDISQNGLTPKLTLCGYLPHSEAVALQQKAGVLLLLVNNTPNARGILTGKFFEYLASGRRILAIGPTDGDVARLLHSTATGEIVDFDDYQRTRDVVLSYFNLYRKGRLDPEGKGISSFSRRELTRKLARILNSMIDG